MADPIDQYDDDFEFGSVPEAFGGSYEGPVGMFLLEFTDMGKPEPVQDKFQNPQKNRTRTWFRFTIVGDAKGQPDPDWDGETVSQFMNISLHEKATLRPCVDALYGGEIPANVKPKKSLLVGKRAFATIMSVPNQSDPSKRHAELSGWTPVDQIMNRPPRRRASAIEAEDAPF